jgi:4-hydroxy-tetrahydrodipicolinate synthase
MTTIDFGRIITAMVTPFGADGTVNYAEAEKLASYLADNGSDAIVVCGTTGESPTLSWQEEFELFRVVCKAVGGKAKVIAGTGSNSTDEAIEATREAAKCGVAGSLQVAPYYNKPPQAHLYEHFRAIAAACDLPMMLYNIPGRTGVNLEPETTIALAKIPNIVCTKEASGNLDIVSQIRANTPAEFAIYAGDDTLTLPMLSIGSEGIVSIASHLVGNRLQEMVAAFDRGDVKMASTIHLELFPLFKGLFATTNPIPIKTALRLQGWQVGGFRAPLGEMTPDLLENLTALLQSYSLIN